MVYVPGIHGPAHELRTKHYGLRFRIMVCVPGIPAERLKILAVCCVWVKVSHVNPCFIKQSEIHETSC